MLPVNRRGCGLTEVAQSVLVIVFWLAGYSIGDCPIYAWGWYSQVFQTSLSLNKILKCNFAEFQPAMNCYNAKTTDYISTFLCHPHPHGQSDWQRVNRTVIVRVLYYHWHFFIVLSLLFKQNYGKHLTLWQHLALPVRDSVLLRAVGRNWQNSSFFPSFWFPAPFGLKECVRCDSVWNYCKHWGFSHFPSRRSLRIYDSLQPF